MISFACRTIDLKDIIRCGFGLTRTEYDLIISLLRQEEPLSVAEIATNAGIERSTAQKALASLLKKKLVARRQFNIPGGGYRFAYELIEKEELRSRLKKAAEGWYKAVQEAINRW